MDVADDFLFKDLATRSQAYIGIATFLNDGRRISIESIEAEPTLTKYPVKNGILICPDDWIILNQEQADVMMYAGVVECRNSENFGKENFGEKIPHFVFFSNKNMEKNMIIIIQTTSIICVSEHGQIFRK